MGGGGRKGARMGGEREKGGVENRQTTKRGEELPFSFHFSVFQQVFSRW